jgi:hypothetical protein
MLPMLTLLCLATVLTVSAFAQDAVIPEALVRSKYVYIGILRADGGFDDGIHPASAPEDRQVRADVEKAFRQWKRYTVTLMPKDADLIVLVRKGRIGSVTVSGTPAELSGGVTIAGRKRTDRDAQSTGPIRPGPGLTIGAEAGPLVDLLEVRFGPARGADTRLWQRAFKDGFSGTPPRLFQRLKAEVEASAKKLGL